MTAVGEAAEPRPPAVKRPWWVPLLGVGSMGIGGMQAVGGLMMLFAGMQVRGREATTFFIMAAAWILPGAALAVSGIGVVTGARWGRWLSLAAVGLGFLLLVPVTLRRSGIPPAIADLLAVARKGEGSSSIISEAIGMATKFSGGDPEAQLRDPGQAEHREWVFAGECCCPALPWQILLVVVCATPLGRRIGTGGGEGG